MSAGVPKPANPAAHGDPKSAPLKEIPDILVDPRTMRRYSRGRFLGKGGFAKCYEITDLETKQVFAGKIVPKSLILKQHQREKMTSEIAIHKSLNHPNIVGFHGFFEDDDFVFVVLEICRRRVSTLGDMFWKGPTVATGPSCHILWENTHGFNVYCSIIIIIIIVINDYWRRLTLQRA